MDGEGAFLVVLFFAIVAGSSIPIGCIALKLNTDYATAKRRIEYAERVCADHGGVKNLETHSYHEMHDVTCNDNTGIEASDKEAKDGEK